MEQTNKTFNQTILDNFKRNYPNLIGFNYNVETDCIEFNGEIIKLNGYGLSRIDPIFFNLPPEDIVLYLKNGFYQRKDEEVYIKRLFEQLLIQEEEEQFLNNYVKSFCDRRLIYAKNKAFFDANIEKNASIKEFTKDIIQGNNVIEDARRMATINGNDAASILNQAYQSYQATLNNEANTQSQTEERGISLTRSKPGFERFEENAAYLKKLQENEKLGIAGFTSIILVILSAITAGMYLALKIMP